MELLIFAGGVLLGATIASVIAFISQRLGHERAFGTISEQLRSTAEQNRQVLDSTTTLHAALAHPVLRGEWGERMVEDVLRPIGFIEGVHYFKQTTMASNSGRPDYTFLLPRKLKVNLEAKFSLDNYRKYHNSKVDGEREELKKCFLRDIRNKVKELAGREYINTSDGTVDFVLMFVPNEPVYCFINEQDPELFDFALGKKIVLCSPWTLYPVLSVIRRAVDNFILERNATELLPLLTKFDTQWNEYKGCLDKMGQKIQDAQHEYDQLIGTRERQLGKVLNGIEQLRKRTDFHSAEPISQDTHQESPDTKQALPMQYQTSSLDSRNPPPST
jgi:DNA recombination protein RmuC